STSLSCDMTFSVYLPPQAAHLGAGESLPAVTWLSGLTCTDENFVQKAGAQRAAAKLGLVLVAPDTSPRGKNVPDDKEKAYDLGLGAGFYVNATQSPWQQHYRMYDYINEELPGILAREIPIDTGRQSLFGHSMGGHGAITIALKNPGKYRSVSAFAPIVAPTQCPWGIKAFTSYLGKDPAIWAKYDACKLIENGAQQLPLLVDQGSADQFLVDQLKPELLVQACADANFPLSYNVRDGYDHSYFFIETFIDEHLQFHASYLFAD
ncbi:MAG: S-formylglutathione hydrolase, partial [Gammaproteobacteria bacterium]